MSSVKLHDSLGSFWLEHSSSISSPCLEERRILKVGFDLYLSLTLSTAGCILKQRGGGES